MPKATRKPLKKTPPKGGEVHERMRKASKPNRRSKKPTDQRMREATRPPRRRTMTDNAQQGNNLSASAQGAPKPTGDKPEGLERGKLSQGAPRAIGAPRTTENAEDQQNSARAAFQGDHPQRSAAVRERARGDREQRGAGTGEEANVTRLRSLIEWPPAPLTHAQHVEELLEIAQENEDFNAAANEEATAVTRNAMTLVGRATYPLGDPALENESREGVLKDYRDAHDPGMKRERLLGEMEARAARDRKQEKEMYEEGPESRDARTDIPRDQVRARAAGDVGKETQAEQKERQERESKGLQEKREHATK